MANFDVLPKQVARYRDSGIARVQVILDSPEYREKSQEIAALFESAPKEATEYIFRLTDAQKSTFDTVPANKWKETGGLIAKAVRQHKVSELEWAVITRTQRVLSSSSSLFPIDTPPDPAPPPPPPAPPGGASGTCETIFRGFGISISIRGGFSIGPDVEPPMPEVERPPIFDV